jgi:hypothetical protein
MQDNDQPVINNYTKILLFPPKALFLINYFREDYFSIFYGRKL